jgi:hypothetical protein
LGILKQLLLNRRAWIFAAAVIAFLVYLALYPIALPIASVDVELRRGDAALKARQFLESQGVDLEGYREVTRFYSSQHHLNHLDRALGSRAAMEVIADAPVYEWVTRFYKPYERRQYYVGFRPDGKLTTFVRGIPEEAPGASLEQSEALQIAAGFLRTELGIALDEYELSIERSQEMPERTDHTFEWKHSEFEVNGATLRVVAVVSGDSVSSARSMLRLSQEVQDNLAKEQYARNILYQIARVFHVLLLVGAVVVVFTLLRKGELRWRFGIILGLALVVLLMAQTFNWLPLSWANYDIRKSPGNFIGLQLLGQVADALYAFLLILLTAVAADAMSRKVLPHHLPPSLITSRPFWTSRTLFASIGVGACLMAFHSAYMVLFYILGQEVGVWSPIQPPLTDTLATPMPWLGALIIGLQATLNEELLFRLFAIALLLHLTKRKWIAIGVPAVIWAFLHSTYPQAPVYIRGLELTVVGIVYGVVFLRYGIFAALISHYTYNALQGALSLIQADTFYFQFSGVLVVALLMLPALPMAVRKLRGKRLLTDTEVRARSPYGHAQPLRVREAPPDGPYEDVELLARRRVVLAAIVGAACLAAMFVLPGGRSAPDYARASVNRFEAMDLAARHLAERDVPLVTYRKRATFRGVPSSAEASYIYQHVSEEEYRRLVRERLASDVGWSIEYFRFRDPTRHRVRIGPDGEVLSHLMILREKAPGESLPEEEALAIAKAHVEELRGYDMSHYRLVESSSRDLPDRRDHRFVWEDERDSVGEAAWRLGVQVAGDQPHGVFTYLDIPEEWYMERSREDVVDVLGEAIGFFVALVIVMLLLYGFIRLYLSGAFDWNASVAFAFFATVPVVVAGLNRLPQLWVGYDVLQPPLTYLAGKAFGAVLAAGGAFLSFAGLFALCDAAFRRSLPAIHPISHYMGRAWKMKSDVAASAWRRLSLKALWGEALTAGIAAGAILAVVESTEPFFFRLTVRPLADLLSFLETGVAAEALPRPVYVQAPIWSAVGGFTTLLPALNSLERGFAAAFATTLLGLAVVAGYFRLFKKRFLPLALLLALAVAVSSQADIGQIPLNISIARTIVLLAAAIVPLYVVIRLLLRRNIAAYGIMLFASASAGHAVDEVLAVPDPFVRANGVLVLAALFVLLFIGLWMRLTASASSLPAKPPAPEPGADRAGNVSHLPQEAPPSGAAGEQPKASDYE